jgi:hypothetical protein
MGDHRAGTSTPGATTSPYDTTGRSGGNASSTTMGTAAGSGTGTSGSSMSDRNAGMSGPRHRMHHATRSTRGSSSDNAVTEELNRQELSRIEGSR